MKCNYCLFCGEKTIIVHHFYCNLNNYTNYTCYPCNTTFHFIRHLDDNSKEDGWYLIRKVFKIPDKNYEVSVGAGKTVIRTIPQYEELVSFPRELNLTPLNVKEKTSLYLLFI